MLCFIFSCLGIAPLCIFIDGYTDGNEADIGIKWSSLVLAGEMGCTTKRDTEIEGESSGVDWFM